MGAFGFIWDAIQDSSINELRQQIDQLQRRTEILEQWIRFLYKEPKEMNMNELVEMLEQMKANQQIANYSITPPNDVYVQLFKPVEHINLTIDLASKDETKQ